MTTQPPAPDWLDELFERNQYDLDALPQAIKDAKLRHIPEAAVDDRSLYTNPVDYHETTDRHTQADELVERLERNSRWLNAQLQCVTDPFLLIKAAATIKELKAEVDQAYAAVAIDCDATTALIERAEAAEDRAAKAEEALRECQDQLASTMSAEEVREAAAKIAEASGNTPRTIASLIRAMPLTK